MGRYINWGDVCFRYKDATEEPADNAEPYFVKGAEAEIDARLAPVYSTPFSVTTQTDAPDLVRSLAIDIAYWMRNRRADWAEKFRDRIDELLQALIDGTMVLTSSAGPLSGADSTISVPSVKSSFGMDEPENWAPSSGWPEYLASGN